MYESQVWQLMITYGGIILSVIKMVGAKRPVELECVYMCFCECVSTPVCISVYCMCVRAKRASPHQKIHLEVIWSFFLKVRRREGG